MSTINSVLHLYSVKDKVSDSLVCTFAALTDGVAVRDNLPALSRAYPLKDIELLHVADIDRESLDVCPFPVRLVSWDCYDFPQARVENLAAGKTVDEAQQSFDKDTADIIK